MGNALAKYWILGGFACKVMPFMTNLSVASSSLTLCCIALDRYNAIVHPLKVNVMKNPRRAAVLLLCVWTVSISASVPYALLYNMYDICKGDSCESVAHLCYASNSGLLGSLEMWLTLVVLLVLPLSFIAITYGIVIWRLWSKRTIGVWIPTAEDLRTRHKKKAVVMMVLVVVLFACCWTPLLLFDVIGREESLKASQTNLILKYFLQWFALSSACYNPIIYAFMNERFRRKFTKLCSCRRARVEPLNSTQTAVPRLRTSRSPRLMSHQFQGTPRRF
ncbi:QRFP-like peptide receptor [Haliotis asinina]|uniref:QRFP-like peptide receptor n=1 Tax=Haliotis asinina TaxID=109174 RepID=UPI003531E434